MIYNNELGIYINKVEDLRDKISEEMYVTIEYLTNGENSVIKEYKDKIEDYKLDKEYYEVRCEDLRKMGIDCKDLILESENSLDDIKDYIRYCKRLNRDKLIDIIYKLENKLNDIKNRIYEEL